MPRSNRRVVRTRRANARAVQACIAETLETRRLLHSTLDPDGDLHMFDINGTGPDTFVVNYIAASDSIQMIHQGSDSHPGALTPRASITGKIYIETNADAGDDQVTINGTAGIDVVIDLGGGNDSVVVNGSVNVVNGVQSKRALVDFFGGPGNDTMTANAGDDTSVFLNGGNGNDTYNVTDTFNGIGFMFGDADNDTFNGAPNGDSFTEADGGAGNDTLNGGSDAETLEGDEGNDSITGGGGADMIKGGADSDEIHTASDGAIDTIDGGAGTDTAYVDPFDVINPAGSVENVNVVISPDAYEPNNSFAAASDLGALGDQSISNLTLHTNSDVDYFKFVAETTGTFSVGLVKNDPTAGAMNVEIFDANFSEITPNSPAMTRSVPVTSGKTYYLVVGSAAGSPVADYTMNIDGPNRPDAVYVSDLTPSSASNGWGPYQRDQSNGESAANDGHTLKLNGTTYSKGLGVHALSKLTYNLGGEYSQFDADLGVDDEVGNNGSVIFQVIADGSVIYTSGILTGSSATAHASVSVDGKNQLQLVVLDAGNGNAYDHADWANAVLSPSTTPPPPPPDGSAVYASDLTPVLAVNGWGPYERDRSNGEQNPSDGKPIQLAGSLKAYDKGLGVHADSNLAYDLTGLGYKSFEADLGVDGEVGSNGSVEFQVLGDGVLLYDSGIVRGGQVAQHASVNIGGHNIISLKVLNGGDGTAFDHADWADAQFRPDGAAPPPPPPTGDVAMSDLTPVLANNGWGPYEKDKSNGETPAGDGHSLIINGVKYDRGLGTHANSDLRYNVGGTYKSFRADIGVDDEVGNNGSVIFQVYGDGVLLYQSGVLTGADAAVPITVPVNGVNQIWLQVKDAGNGNAYDHADWGSAKLVSQ